MGVEAAMSQADLLHDLGDARAVVPSSPSSARGGRDDPFVGDFLAAGGGPPGGGSAHMMSIIYQSGAERKGPTPSFPASAGALSYVPLSHPPHLRGHIPSMDDRDAQFTAARPTIFAIAYRMVGTVMDAE